MAQTGNYLEDNQYPVLDRDVEDGLTDDNLINGITLANSLDYQSIVDYLYSVLTKDKQQNEIDVINAKLEELNKQYEEKEEIKEENQQIKEENQVPYQRMSNLNERQVFSNGMNRLRETVRNTQQEMKMNNEMFNKPIKFNQINSENILSMLENVDPSIFTNADVKQIVIAIIELAKINDHLKLQQILDVIPEFLLDDMRINFDLLDFSDYETLELVFKLIPIETSENTLTKVVERGDVRILKLLLEYDLLTDYDEETLLANFELAVSKNLKDIAEELKNLLDNNYNQELNQIYEEKQKLQEKLDVNEFLNEKLEVSDEWLNNASLGDQIEFLKECIIKNEIQTFINSLKVIYKLNGEEQFNNIYNEILRLNLMMTIVKESINLDYNDLMTILEECDGLGISKLNNKSFGKLYDEALLVKNQELQEYMYDRFHDYFINRLIDDVIEDKEKDFDFLLSVIPKNILNDYKDEEISQKTVDIIFMSATSVERLKKLYEILDLPLDDSTLLAAVNGGDVDVVKFLIEEVSDLEYFTDVMSEAIELSKEVGNSDVTNYLKRISNPQYSKALNRLNKTLQHVKSKAEVNKMVGKEKSRFDENYVDEFLEDEFEKSEVGQELGLSRKIHVGLPWEVENTTLKPVTVSNAGIGTLGNVPRTRTNINTFSNVNSNVNANVNNGRVRVTMQNPTQPGVYRSQPVNINNTINQPTMIDSEQIIQPTQRARLEYNRI